MPTRSGFSPPPPNPYVSETAFSHRFQKAYTYPPPPPTERNFGALDQNLKKNPKIANSLRVGMNRMSPRDMVAKGAYRALCARCAKSWLFSTAGSSVSSED